MRKQQCVWPRGKALGGTSVINYMIYTRGNQYDFDRWAALGNPDWTWDKVVPYYIKSENGTKVKNQDPGQHGTNGYLTVNDNTYNTLGKTFCEAGRELGHKVLDYNGFNQFGFSIVQSTTRNGRRCSAAKSFLRPAKQRPNLRILPMSRAKKVLIHPVTKKAYGIEYTRNKKAYTAIARKEVILSAGPFASPQLLMLSGIGPEDHLREKGIQVIKNLPVGKFLQDHLTFVGLTFLVNDTVAFNYEDVAEPKFLQEYLSNGTGPLTSLGGVEALGYIKTKVSEEVIDYPDVELIFLAGALNTDSGGPMRLGMNIKQSFYNQTFASINGLRSWSIIPMLLHPKSTGYLKLNTTNIFNHPLLYGNYYSDPGNHDIKTMIAAIRKILKLSETQAFKKYGSFLHATPFAGCESFEFNSDPYWECCLRHLSPSLHHQVGTCRMGPKNDPMAVVDNYLRVHGVNHLRVVDSSVIPFAISAHTNAPAFMIGEKAADFIKADWLQNEVDSYSYEINN